MRQLDNDSIAPKYYFFSGKGGVGKTSLSSATAVYLADSGLRTLIVTTDPASNLADVLEQPIGHKIASVPGVPGLAAMELDPDIATAEYKERTLAPLRAFLPRSAIDVMDEQLSSPCTAEMATFERFIEFLGDQQFDAVVFDTAPTGHTLRLLELPGDWSKTIADAAESGGSTCIGPAQALADSRAKFDRAMVTLKDARQTSFQFVVRPEESSILESKRSIGELSRLGIHGVRLIVNGLIPEEACSNEFFQAKRSAQLDALPVAVAADPGAKAIFLLDHEIRGVSYLRKASEALMSTPLFAKELLAAARTKASDKNLRTLPDAVAFPATAGVPDSVISLEAAQGGTHLLFFAGKGGVGKTTMSCVAATKIAGQGNHTLLVTTDPAAHLANVLDAEVGGEPTDIPGAANLSAMRIDPKAEAKKYKAKVLAEAEGKYSADRLAAMSEELDSPCTEEMAVFYRFIDIVDSSDYDVIVFDTAPTGHTLRLLRLPVEWSQQLEIKTFATEELSEADAEAKSKFARVIARLRDPRQTSFIFVVYPEHTPIVEAHRAAQDLASIGIEPAFVIANQVLPASECSDGLFMRRQKMQVRYLSDIPTMFSAPVVFMPLLAREPVGLDDLRAAPIVFEVFSEKREANACHSRESGNQWTWGLGERENADLGTL